MALTFVRALGLAICLLASAATQSNAAGNAAPVGAAADTLTRFDGRTIERVELSGFSTTRRHVIERELHLSAGDPFSAARLRDDLVRLENLGVFSSIDTRVSESGAGVILLYDFHEMPWIVALPMAVKTDQDGWSFGAGVATLNLAGRAIQVGGSVLFGGMNTGGLLLWYPWMTGNHVSLELLAQRVERDDTFLDFREKSIEITPWIGRWIGKRWRFRGGVSYLQMRSDADSVTLAADNRDDLVRVGVALGVDTRDRWRDPRSGWRGEALVMKTGGALGGDGATWLGELSVERFQATFRRQNLLLYGLAAVQSGEVGRDVPAYLQYRMGGANSIRGYDVDVLGQEIFGKHQLLGTAEYEVLVMPLQEVSMWRFSVSTGLKLAAFVDVGTAWNTESQLRRSRVRTGYGLGIRWLVPGVNVVRFDIGFSEDGDARFHIGIADKAGAQRDRLR